jgi:hypothetical protein
MIANFFQSLNSSAVDYLLISGQATVLYGASTFSEDIDIWINPTPGNCEKFLSVLRSIKARYYKLTPALTVANLQRGHGFHFLFSDDAGNEVFLDIMGVPPRVRPFESAVTLARWMETQWGKVHTIGLKDLVEVKKTQRLEDYPIISNLALAWFDQPECKGAVADFDWALENIFTLTALRSFFEEHGVINPNVSIVPEMKRFAECLAEDQPVPEEIEGKLTVWMQQRIAALQRADRIYWRQIIAELKQLRTDGKLMKEDSEV